MNDELKSRIGYAPLLDKVMTAEDAVSFIKPGMTLGISGFSGIGYPKKIPAAIADRANAGEKMNLTLYSGASTGDGCDGVLARSGAVICRMPYNSNKDMRNEINKGRVKFVDLPLAQMPGWVRNKILNHIDVAVVEVTMIDEEGHIIPTLSMGASETYISCADKVILEVNTTIPKSVAGIHDSYIPKNVPFTEPIPITKPGDRIGTPYIACPPEKIVAIVESDLMDDGGAKSRMDDDYKKISDNLVSFLKGEVEKGRLCNPLPPIQAGVGAVSDAVLQGLVGSNFEHMTIYSEVMQDSLTDLITAGKVDMASACAISISRDKMDSFYENLPAIKDKLILRPMEISNSHEIIRRLGIISINTAIEADLYGNVNSSYIGGNRLMNGIGGSNDFCENAGIAIYLTKSTAKDGSISSIVPIAPHIDHTSKSVHVLITEQGVADLRGLDRIEAANLIINNCAHPSYKAALNKYFERALILSDYMANPISQEAAMRFYESR